MKNRPNVVIVMARCNQNMEYFGIRFEEKDGPNLGLSLNLTLARKAWVGDWAFKLEKELGKKEGYDKNKINGIIALNPAYPGCPHCGQKLIVKCPCGEVACHGDQNQMMTCPSCGITASLDGYIQSLNAGEDR